jgi:aldehyde:ferredoxin oxidoreductase
MADERQIAYVNLSSGEITRKKIPEKLRKLFLGGRGIDIYLLYNHIRQGIDPLGPENVLIVSAGLLTGTPSPASARCHVAAKSPLTGLVGSTNMGGFFAPELRFAGIDHLVIQGKSEVPVYLWVKNGRIEIRDASHLWGKDTFETQRILRRELDDQEVKIMTIGLGGEKLVKYACVRTGLKNAGGRTGMGCVMGSKNLKAIAVRGTMDIQIAHPEKALENLARLNQQILSTKAAKALGTQGTMMIYGVTNNSGLIRTRNFQLNKQEDWERMAAENMEKYSVGTQACFGCVVHCRHKWHIKDGPYAGLRGEGPEYNSQVALGNLVNAKELETVIVGSYLVDKYGIDITEVGNLTAWVMELYEKGIVDDQAAGGLDLSWDNGDKLILEMIEKIAHREGLGDILAEGPYGAIQKFGPESEYYLMHIKGLSNIGSDERPTPALALGIATATRGSDHLRSRPATDLFHLPEEVLEKIYGGPVSSDYGSYAGKGRMVQHQESVYAVVDALGTCKFQTIFFSPHMPNVQEFAEHIKYITGMEFTPEELLETGQRITALERMFNIREGKDRKDDYLPERYYRETTKLGYAITRDKRIVLEKFDEMLDEYYTLHGWDKNGIPRTETLEKLELAGEPSHLL